MPQNIYGLGDYNTIQIKEMVRTIAEEKLSTALILQRRPDAAENPVVSIAQIPNEMAGHIVPDAFAGQLGQQLAARLSNQQMETIGSEGDPYLRYAIRAALDEAFLQNPNDEEVKKRLDYTSQSPAWQ